MKSRFDGYLDAKLASENKVELKKLFHECWTAAHDSPDYDKNKWHELRSAIEKEMDELIL